MKLTVNNLNTVHVVLRIPVWAFSDITEKHIKPHYIEAQQKKEKNSDKFFLLHYAGTEYAKIIFPLSGSSQTFMFLRMLP